MKLASTAFVHQGYIPKHYTCEDANVSPPLQFYEIPENTQSLALICDDPDAATDPDGPGKTFDHWVIANMPPQTVELEEAANENSFTTGNNSAGPGYTGPCPPNGVHRYFFRLYALDTELMLERGFTKEKLLETIAGHVLEEAELIGLYEKQDS